MTGLLHLFEFWDTRKDLTGHFYVAAGDETFLKRLALKKLKASFDADSLTTFTGETTEWRDVQDELSTLSLFGPGARVVLVESADDFVSNSRSQLEEFCANPGNGCLILDVRTFPANTKLYQSAVKHATVISCRLPQTTKGKSIDKTLIKEWLIKWSKQIHGLILDQPVVEEILDLVGLELGLIDQELAKLALFTKPSQPVSMELVHQVIGGWRQKTTWDMIDAAASGDAATALNHLDHLLQSGEHPNMLFGSLSWSLRRFAAATRIVQRQEAMGQRVDLKSAATEAGFRQWPRDAFDRSIRQLKQLGRARGSEMYRWLLETDLSLKGSHSAPEKARFAVEQLIFKMAKR